MEDLVVRLVDSREEPCTKIPTKLRLNSTDNQLRLTRNNQSVFGSSFLASI